MKDLIFTFEDLGTDKATKKVTAAFAKAGESVVSSTPSAKMMRTAGVTYRTLDLTFADGQTLTLMVKQTGDIYQVKLNGSVVPVKNQDDQKKAVAELVKLMETNRPKFQAKLAKTKAELPAGTKSAAPKVEEQLKARIAELDTQISERRDTVQKLQDELGTAAMDSANGDPLHESNETPEEENEEQANGDDDEAYENEDQGSLFDECADDKAMDSAGECAGCGMPSAECECEPISKEPYKRTWAMMDAAGSGYTIYHKMYASACKEAIAYAEKNGYEVDMDDWHDKVSVGPKKPDDGKTNRFSIGLTKDDKPQKKALQFQVYGRDNGYELNCYIS